MALPSFIRFATGQSAGPAPAAEKLTAALALVAKSEATIAALNEKLDLTDSALAERQATIAALNEKLDLTESTLTERETALTALQATLTERETALATALAALAEMPEKIKAEAIALAAASGIPASGTPPIPHGPFTGSTPAPITLEAFRTLSSVEKMAFSTAGGRIASSN